MPLRLFTCISKRLFNNNHGPLSELFEELKLRGLISQIAQPQQWLDGRTPKSLKLKLYCGADPTAKSLHLGNVVPLMILLNFYVKGYDVFTLVGGATGRIGDPSGKTTERNSMSDQSRLENVCRIQDQYQMFFTNGWKYYVSRCPQLSGRRPGQLIKVNNYDWWKDVKLLDFLSQYGRYIRVQSMFSRSSITSRMESSGDGIGFNEFTYQVLQAYDFYYLYKTYGVSFQVGGNDQWGNITAGIDFIDRMMSSSSDNLRKLSPGGMTAPLLTNSAGQKFGKSAGNAIFIDPKVNTAYDIFQFFYNTDDTDIAKLLKIFTLLPLQTIEKAVWKHSKEPHLRMGQKLLAIEATDLLFGVGSGERSSKVSEILFGNLDEIHLSTSDMIQFFSEAKILWKLPGGQNLVDIIARVTPCSKSEARRKLTQGSIMLYPFKCKVTENIDRFDPFLIDGKVLILRIGKQKRHVIELL